MWELHGCIVDFPLNFKLLIFSMVVLDDEYTWYFAIGVRLAETELLLIEVYEIQLFINVHKRLNQSSLKL